jgi:hypothetical protein
MEACTRRTTLQVSFCTHSVCFFLVFFPLIFFFLNPRFSFLNVLYEYMSPLMGV